MISQNDKKPKILGDKKLTSIKERGVTSIKKNYKNLRINIQNSNCRLTTIPNTNSNKNTHSKNSLISEQFSKGKKNKTIHTETAYGEKKLSQNKNKFKYNKAKRTKNSKSKNKTQKSKEINIKINNSNKNLNDNKIKRTPKNNKLIEEYNLTKVNKLYLPKVLKENNIYKFYSRDNLSKYPNTSRNYEFYASHKKINNDAIKFDEQILRSQPHIRKINMKSIYNKNKNYKTLTQNIINYDTSLDIKSLYYAKNYYQYKDIYQNLSFKLKAKNKDKSLFNKKIKDILACNNSLTHINKESPKNVNLKNTNTKKKGSKIINFLDLMKMKKKKIRKNHIYNKSNKTNNNIKENSSEDNSKIKYIRYKTNDDSIRNIDSILRKKSFKSCDIPLKVKKLKNRKDLSIIPIIKLVNSDKIIKHKYSGVNKDKNHIFNENKIKNKTKGLIQKGSYMKKESSYDFLESESEKELNKELINEIKINNFDVNKPKEQNMKYTLYKEFKEENENENESSKPESHLSKIIIGEIESYKDIIEKDKINVKNNLNINKDKSELITVPVDDSIESEKFIINMINFDDNENNSSLFSNEFKNTISNEKIIKNNLKNTSFYPKIKYINQTRNNNLNNNKKGGKIKLEKNSKNKSKDQIIKRYPKIIKKIKEKTKINDRNNLSKSNSKINRNKNINILKIKRTIASPLNKKKLTISKDSIGDNNNLISKFIDENNKRDENCSIF